MNRKQNIIHKTMLAEGGFVSAPSRIDQPTNIGITAPTLAAFNARHPELRFPTRVADIAPTHAEIIYGEMYYDARHIDEIRNDRIAAAIFDMGVMSNFKNVVKLVQRTLNTVCDTTLATDGIMGPHTVCAINAIPTNAIDRFMAALKTARIEYLRALPGWAKFGVGWTRRTNGY